MKSKRVKSISKPMKFGKRLLTFSLLISLLLIPELIWHKLAVFVHILYESLSFLLELALTHGFGVSKFYAQMAVFYFIWAVALLLLFVLWRKLPALLNKLKTNLLNHIVLVKHRVSKTWRRLSGAQKIKLLLFQFASVAGGLMFLLT